MGVGGRVNAAWDGRRPRMFPPEFDWVVGCSYRGLPERQAPVRNMIGANMAFRREVFDAVGGFRSDVGRVGARPLGLRGDRALHPRAQLAAGRDDPVRAERAGEPPRHDDARDLALLRLALHRRRAVEGRRRRQRRRERRRSPPSATTRCETLPSGVARGVADAALRGDVAGMGRAGAIVAGLGLTAGGYIAGRASRYARRAPARPQRAEPALGGARP